MLKLSDICLEIGRETEVQTLLHKISLHFPTQHFGAIVGPSGCGKTTLLKVIAGICIPDEGSVYWNEQNLADDDFLPTDIGYVPQFSIAYDYLTVWENIEAALKLRVRGIAGKQQRERIRNILQEIGLEEIAHRQVRVLSGGQKRRLALALEIASYPFMLLCDEVTSGLDPKSEEEIVALMHQLSKEQNRIVLSVTHSLRHFHLYDSIAVLYQGCVAYHGPSKFLLQYFNVDHLEKIYPQLARKSRDEWHLEWLKRRRIYDFSLWSTSEKQEVESKLVELNLISQPHQPEKKPLKSPTQDDDDEEMPASASPDSKNELGKTKNLIPGYLTQFWVLLHRRWRIFFRDSSQVWLQAILMLGFPCLVVIFALNGLPQIQNLTMEGNANVIQQLQETNSFILQSTKVGSLVSGLVMFQVILLTLMGSNNSAREIASERLIFEKEKLAGLRSSSYLTSKVCFLFCLVATQSIWMAVFVNLICRFPGNLLTQIILLVLVNGAMTAVCLGISSLMRSSEQASLVSIYLVGFQLPLSGAVLALPEFLNFFTKPFIAAYWSWAGVLQTMRDTRFYDVVQNITQTSLSPIELCIWTLGFHVILGTALAYIGCKQNRWE